MTSVNPEFGTTLALLARRMNQSRVCTELQSNLIAIKFDTTEARRLNWASVLHHCLLGYLPLAIDKLLESAVFYWTMDDDKKINNDVGSDFGVSPRDVNTIKGIRGKALNVKHGISGALTLTEGLVPSECLFDTSKCNEGFTLMSWLWYKHNSAGQVFLASNADNYRGHKMFQINSGTPQVAYQIINSNKKCIVVFPTPKEVWTHYALTYSSLDDLDSINVFVNGEEIKDFVFKECSDGSFAINNITRFSVGDSSGVLPEAAFDEVIIWYRKLTSEDILTAYTYYKGNMLKRLLLLFLSYP